MKAIGLYLKVNKIKDIVGNSWVLLGDPEVSENNEVIGGNLLFYDKNKDKVFKKAKETKSERITIIYMGKQPKNNHLIL
jgi:lipopolysaccharide export system protein LptA